MADRLKLPRIQGKPLEIDFSPHFDRESYFRGKPHLLDPFLDIVDAIKAGKPLPKWAYRRDIDTTPDAVLQRDGYMHLHLGSQGSRELLYLIQYDDHVMFLEIASHRHFETHPPGILLKQRHEIKIRPLRSLRQARKLQETQQKEAENADRKKSLRERLGVDKKKSED